MTAPARDIRIICADSLAMGREIFETIGHVDVIQESDIARETICGADILVTRSKVRVDENLIKGSSLKFYGTATAGYDHVDADALAEHGISWTAAPGCNANSVAEFVVASLARIGVDHAIDWTGKTLGIIGAGHVGSTLASRAQALGLSVLLNDPPLFETTGDPKYLPLEDVLARSDIISLHVPLTNAGKHPTQKMANTSFFSRLNPGTVFINASRGGVVDERALKDAVRDKTCSYVILDVFENEPGIDPDMLTIACIATPHIAGYSYDSRVKGTEMVYRTICRHLGLEPIWKAGLRADTHEIPTPSSTSNAQVLYRIILSAYDPRTDDAQLRKWPHTDSLGRHFKNLRSNYPKRLEFEHYTVSREALTPDIAASLKTLGFVVLSST